MVNDKKSPLPDKYVEPNTRDVDDKADEKLEGL
jgi:hypothetical protein